MNKNRATHLGTCQCCLAVQMLPSGLLSNHGYQVAFRGQGGFFSGVCRGSKELPFELSCESMKRFVYEAADRQLKLVENIAKVKSNAIEFPTQGWYLERVKPDWENRRGFDRWVYITYQDGVCGNTGEPIRYCSVNAGLAINQAKKGNEAYAYYLQCEHDHLTKFIDERNRMIDNWKLRLLIDRLRRCPE